MKERHYRAEYKKHWQRYWDHWKYVHLEGGRSPVVSVKASRPPARASPPAGRARYTTRSTTRDVDAKPKQANGLHIVQKSKGNKPHQKQDSWEKRTMMRFSRQSCTTTTPQGGLPDSGFTSKGAKRIATDHKKSGRTIPLPPKFKAQQRRQRKCVVRKQRDMNAGPRSDPNPIEPISSRLRSSHQDLGCNNTYFLNFIPRYDRYEIRPLSLR